MFLFNTCFFLKVENKMLNYQANNPPKPKTCCRWTFAIQQVSSAVMHATPIQPKYYIIILLLYAGWYRCHWQGYGCLCVCVCRWVRIIKLAGTECTHASCIVYCVAHSLSTSPPFPLPSFVISLSLILQLYLARVPVDGGPFPSLLLLIE